MSVRLLVGQFPFVISLNVGRIDSLYSSEIGVIESFYLDCSEETILKQVLNQFTDAGRMKYLVGLR